MSDFDRTFNIWTDVGLFCFIVFVLVSVISNDASEVRVHNSDSGILPLFTGFLIGRYLK